MNCPLVSAFALAILLFIPSALAAVPTEGTIEVQRIEATSNGHTTGPLAALLIGGEPDNGILADPHFTLTTPDTSIHAYRATLWAAGTDVASSEQPVHEGPATIDGLETRSDFHLWITPLNGAQPTIRIEHPSCTMFQGALESEEVRERRVDRIRPDVVVPTHGTVDVASCGNARAVIEGDVSLIAWEWDIQINDRREDTGINDTTHSAGLTSGAGSASELTIHARNATLSIPLTPQTYELFLGHPQLEARNLRLIQAEGSLPGILESVQGKDVDVAGDFVLDITANGGDSLTAVITGTTYEANAGSESLALYAPEGSNAPVLPIAAGAATLLIGAALAGTTIHRHRNASTPPRHRQRRCPTRATAPAPAPHPSQFARRSMPAAPTQRDVAAERAIRRVVERVPGVTKRQLHERIKQFSKDRVNASLANLLDRGVLVQKGSPDSALHIFVPTPDLDETWQQKALLTRQCFRLLYDLVQAQPGVEQRTILALCRERWNWAPSTTKGRLHRLASVGLLKATESGRDAALSVTWAPAAL